MSSIRDGLEVTLETKPSRGPTTTANLPRVSLSSMDRGTLKRAVEEALYEPKGKRLKVSSEIIGRYVD